MSLAPNKQFDHYEIIAPLGKGGMGEVYRALDTRLNREVALKVLPAEFAQDADRLRRFEQEAHATSGLNHPNILTVYDFGTGSVENGGNPYLVMELLEGEELRAQLDAGAVPVRKAIEYAQQIVAGLAAAHEKGVVHRDLKPENLFVTNDGRVKILDFGLAKLTRLRKADFGQRSASNWIEEDADTLLQPPSANPQSPIRNPQLTTPGTVMGTVAYMSPEQVRGETVDHRSDIFSFGLVLFEMLRGERAFQRETMAETMTAILKDDPPELSETNAKIAPQLEKIVRRCLEKKPERRFHSAHDLGFALEALSVPSSSGARSETATTLPAVTDSLPTTRKARLFSNARLAWIAATVCLLIALAALPFAVAYFRRAPIAVEAVRFSITAPEQEEISWFAVSPDGRRVVIAGRGRNQSPLWVRPLNAVAAQPLRGTERATYPFWSPDSRFIGFFAGGKLKKIELSGGPPQTLCDAPQGQGGTWNRAGIIVFGSSRDGRLYRVSSTGGAVTVATTPAPSRRETAHRWPHFLPDDDHFIYTVDSTQPENRALYVGSLDAGEPTRLLAADSNAAYTAADAGYLFFMRGETLMAQPFDAQKLKLTGEPSRIAEQVRYEVNSQGGFFSISQNGVLAYDPTSVNETQRLGWFDRAGKQLSTFGAEGMYRRFALSSDDQHIVLVRLDPQTRLSDLWLHDLGRDVAQRFTFDSADEDNAHWSPDGRSVVFRSNREGVYDLYQQAANSASQAEPLLKSNLEKTPTDWSSDGRFIIYIQRDPKTKLDVWVLPLFGDRKPFPLLQTEFLELTAQLSPDMKWIAYSSDESGDFEVYVQPFPASGGKWQVSKGGGANPHWRRDGKELYYLGGGKLMAVAVKGGASFEAGPPQALFDLPQGGNRFLPYSVTAGGQRFLLNTREGESRTTKVTVVLNWMAEMKR